MTQVADQHALTVTGTAITGRAESAVRDTAAQVQVLESLSGLYACAGRGGAGQSHLSGPGGQPGQRQLISHQAADPAPHGGIWRNGMWRASSRQGKMAR